MHILNVNQTLDPVSGGGTAERTFQLSRYLARDPEVEVSLLTLDIGMTEQRYRDLSAVNLIVLPCLNRRFYIPPITDSKIVDVVNKADIVHLMGHWTILNLIVYYWIRKLRKPYVVCPAGALPIFGRSRLLKKVYNNLGGRSYIRNANLHVAISQSEYESFASYGVPADKVHLIPNGIEPESYVYRNDEKIRDQFGLGAGPFLLFVGRLNLIKGPDLLLEAFVKVAESFSSHQLVFVGPDDGMLGQLRAMVAKYGLQERVRFVGYVDGAQKSELYHAADLLVIPSRLEAMSIVVLEAAMTGTPVLMTDKCGLDEMTGEAGGVAVSPTVEGLVAGLRQLLTDRDRLVERGQKLHQYVENHFTWANVVDQYQKLYNKL